MYIKAKDEATLASLQKKNSSYIERFCNPSELVIETNVQAPEQCMTAVITGAELFLPLEDLINLDEEIARLEKKELKRLDSEVERVQKKLSNEGFVKKKAPAQVIEEERKKQQDYTEKKREAVRQRLAELKK
ncbi:hypothetical protein GCM10020331_034940 [Ectobacillus funiculus]